uniref:Transposase zinc-binding domain-containing protein n=1 Tax=Candidatus Kentrum sp. TC TaxID=2126339 RepID=A0A450YRY7_9GAMM|nr:MAG: Transposase zinc-binding domain-containing protein [Candidatus Kentron sp. TC]
MESISKSYFTLQRIFKGNWERFVLDNRSQIPFSSAYDIWKVMNCREPDGLGYATYACPEQITHIPKTRKSRFRPVRAKIQVDKRVADMSRLFPNCPYFFHITFTVPSRFRTLLFEKRSFLNAVFSAGAQTILSFR